MTFVPTPYPAFMQPYFNQVRDAGISDLHNLSEHANEELLKIFRQVPLHQTSFTYQAGKWSIAEMLQHILDTDKVFTYRAFCISRNDKTHLPSFDEDAYIENSHTAFIDFQYLLQEYTAHYQYMCCFFKGLTSGQLDIIGRTTEYEITPRLLGYAMAGHKLHHVHVMKERYLPLIIENL